MLFTLTYKYLSNFSLDIASGMEHLAKNKVNFKVTVNFILVLFNLGIGIDRSLNNVKRKTPSCHF